MVGQARGGIEHELRPEAGELLHEEDGLLPGGDAGDEPEMIGDDVDFTAEELEDLDRAHDKYIAELEAKRADAASRRNATKRQARAEAKNPRPSESVWNFATRRSDEWPSTVITTGWNTR